MSNSMFIDFDVCHQIVLLRMLFSVNLHLNLQCTKLCAVAVSCTGTTSWMGQALQLLEKDVSLGFQSKRRTTALISRTKVDTHK